ncbi:MAG: aldo/keto reductase [Prevotella sp.]|nr:aldo/keto reductase [Prevotella sp.]
MNDKKNDMNRRQFIKHIGTGTLSAMALMSLEPLNVFAKSTTPSAPQTKQDGAPKMTYRVNHHTNDKVSLLGFGMMRLPKNQDKVNELVDYALAHGVNYFDTAPAYGNSEVVTGIALKRHPRNSYYIATKMSNQNRRMHSFEESKKMYERSFERLQIDYIDYYLLHSIGGSGMDEFRERFINNGLLDFLVKERDAGRIRNLGFSYHGNVEVFDWLVDNNDKYNFTFVQIELNYIDWRHASLGNGGWKKDADAEYLYNKLEKAGLQAVVMEPLLGGRLANIPDEFANQLKAKRPNDSIASWAFRWVGTLPNILTALSGMNNMEHLEDNVNTFSPLDPCTEQEKTLLAQIADGMNGYPTIPCTACSYCMPCPYGVNIPKNFSYYNEAVNNKLLPLPDKSTPDYSKRIAQFKKGYKKAIDKKAGADQCMDCEVCLKKCPQQIRIPNQMARIVELIKG